MSPVVRIGSKTKQTAAKPTARRGTAKRNTVAKAKPRAASSNGSNRRPLTDDQRVIDKHIAILEEIGEERKEAEIAHKEAVQAVYEATREAMEAGVPTGMIVDAANITRQWLYNMNKHGGADREGMVNGEPVSAKPATSRRRTARATAATPKRRKSAAKSGANKISIRTR